MPSWIIKAAVQKGISVMPFSFRINYLFQRHITKAVILNDAFIGEILDEVRRMQKGMESFFSKNLIGKRVLELGTGWHPIAPVSFFLLGAEKITTIDLRKLIRRENLVDLISFLKKYEENGSIRELLPGIQKDRWEQLISLDTDKPLEELLNSLHIQTEAGDINKLDLKNEEFDLCYSINVLEHVYKEVLHNIIDEMYSLGKPGSFHFHMIGCYDHFFHVDKQISKFNYLRFSAKQWKLIDNDIQPQNRLRVAEFDELFRNIGYSMLSTGHSDPNYQELNKLNTVDIVFRNIPEEILAVDYARFYMVK